MPFETALKMGWPEPGGSGGEELNGLSIRVFRTSRCGFEGSVLLAILGYRVCEVAISVEGLGAGKVWVGKSTLGFL